jgi:hypothetical protein
MCYTLEKEVFLAKYLLECFHFQETCWSWVVKDHRKGKVHPASHPAVPLPLTGCLLDFFF